MRSVGVDLVSVVMIDSGVIGDAMANPSVAAERLPPTVDGPGDGVDFDRDKEDDGPEGAVGCRGRRHSLLSRRAHQRECGSMARELGELRVITKPQREHVAGSTDDDGFPPAVFKRLLGDDEVTRRDLVPGPG